MSESNNAPESAQSAPVLANAGVGPANNVGNTYRSVTSVPAYATPAVALPALPPRLDMQNQSYGMSQYPYGGMGGSYGMGGMGGMGGYGGYGMGGMGGMGGYGGYGMGGMGMGQNPYGHGNIESRFIQLAEENSRPAFETIQSFVHAVGGVSMMLENTFFAMTSSFRAILGVAENFGRLRSLFAQFWTTFGVIRSINWMIRKLLVMLGIRSEAEFMAWAEAVAATQTAPAPGQKPRGASWPVLLFFAVVAAAPYLVLKMMSGVTSSIESLNEPATWKNALKGVAQHAFQSTKPQELSFNQNQVLKIAPQILQGALWDSGWLIATVDGVNPGYVPTNHIKIIQDEASMTHKTQVEPNQLHCSLSG